MGYSSQRFRTLEVEQDYDPRTIGGIERLKELCAKDANRTSPFDERPDGITICAITEIQEVTK